VRRDRRDLGAIHYEARDQLATEGTDRSSDRTKPGDLKSVSRKAATARDKGYPVVRSRRSHEVTLASQSVGSRRSPLGTLAELRKFPEFKDVRLKRFNHSPAEAFVAIRLGQHLRARIQAAAKAGVKQGGEAETLVLLCHMHVATHRS